MKPSVLLVLRLLLGAALAPFAAQAQAPPFQVKDKYYALLLAVDRYNDPRITSLDYPVADARRLRDVLVQDYQFEAANVQLLANPDRGQIFAAFENVRNKMNVDDNLFIFFAGHGDWDKEANVGYWWPADTRHGSYAQKITSTDLQLLIKELNCRHVLLVVDACYGGSVFKTRGPSDSEPALRQMYDKVSRKAITSADLEDVPDRGFFAEALVEVLRNNPYRHLPGQVLHARVWDRVTAPKPTYGFIAGTGDNGGEFLFVRRRASREDPPDDPPAGERPVAGPYSQTVTVAGRGVTPVSLSVRKGDKITIRASGTVKVGFWVGEVTPEGKDMMNLQGVWVRIAPEYDVVARWRHGALLYRLSTGDPQWRLCGGGCELTAPATGNLEITFQLNDLQLSDNSGHFTADVTVHR